MRELSSEVLKASITVGSSLASRTNHIMDSNKKAEVSGVELNSKSSPNNLQIRSSDITPPPELVQEWYDQTVLAANGIHCFALALEQLDD